MRMEPSHAPGCPPPLAPLHIPAALGQRKETVPPHVLPQPTSTDVSKPPARLPPGFPASRGTCGRACEKLGHPLDFGLVVLVTQQQVQLCPAPAVGIHRGGSFVWGWRPPSCWSPSPISATCFCCLTARQ